VRVVEPKVSALAQRGMRKIMSRKAILFITGVSISAAAMGLLEPIPQESGFSGFVVGGASVNRVENAMIAGTDFGNISSPRVDSINRRPDPKTDVNALFGGELKYTFASTRTQVFFGNSLEDWVRYDFASTLSVRQEMGDAGVLEGSFLFTSFPTQVWADPYVAGVDRKETDRVSTGGRMGIYNLLKSGIDLRASVRNVEIENENSGASEVLLTNILAAEKSLLERDGREYKVDLAYNKRMGRKHTFSPQLSFTKYDLEGKAMAGDKIWLQLTHIYINGRWRLITNMGGTVSEYEKDNPIYDKKRDGIGWGGSFSALYGQLFDIEGLSARLSAVYFEENSDIDFYDSSVLGANLGLLYKF
jgi:hypothetical protein